MCQWLVVAKLWLVATPFRGVDTARLQPQKLKLSNSTSSEGNSGTKTIDLMDLISSCRNCTGPGDRLCDSSHACIIRLKTERVKCNFGFHPKTLTRSSLDQEVAFHLSNCRFRNEETKRQGILEGRASVPNDNLGESSCDWGGPASPTGACQRSAVVESCWQASGCFLQKDLRPLIVTNSFRRSAIVIQFQVPGYPLSIAVFRVAVLHMACAAQRGLRNSIAVGSKFGAYVGNKLSPSEAKKQQNKLTCPERAWPWNLVEEREITDKGAQEHIRWLGRWFASHGESVLDAVAALSDPGFARDLTRHPAWRWAADTSIAGTYATASLYDPTNAQFSSWLKTIPRREFLSGCSDTPGSRQRGGTKCKIHISNQHFSCGLTFDRWGPGQKTLEETCFLRLRQCSLRNRYDRRFSVQFQTLRKSFSDMSQCLSRQGCCVPRASVNYIMNDGALPTGSASLMIHTPKRKIYFDKAQVVSSGRPWACLYTKFEECPKALVVADYLKKDSLRTGGNQVLQMVGSLLSNDVLVNAHLKVESEMCVDSGLAHANRLRSALMVKAFSGLVAASVGICFPYIAIPVKLLIRIAAGGKYAKESCVFEVASRFPGLRDEVCGDARMWSYPTTSKIKACMDTKNKLKRMYKSATKVRVPFHSTNKAAEYTRSAGGVIQAITSGSAKAGVVEVSSAGSKLIAESARDAMSAVGGVVGTTVATAIRVGGTPIPVVGLVLGILEAIAGVYQATSLYKWARMQTYLSCTEGVRADAIRSTRELIEKFNRFRDDFQSFQSKENEPRTSFIKELLQCAIGKARTKEHTEQARGEFNRLSLLLKSINDDGNNMDEAILRLHKEVLEQLGMMREVEKRKQQSYKRKERREFKAELALNPGYVALETLFPNSKYIPIGDEKDENILATAEAEFLLERNAKLAEIQAKAAYDTNRLARNGRTLNHTLSVARTDGDPRFEERGQATVEDFCGHSDSDTASMSIEELVYRANQELNKIDKTVQENKRDMDHLLKELQALVVHNKELDLHLFSGPRAVT